MVVGLQRALLRPVHRGTASFQRSFFVSAISFDEKKKDDKPQIRGIPYTNLSIGVPKESLANERRVAQTPATVSQLVKSGFKVFVEAGAGSLSNFSDGDYAKSGASVVTTKEVSFYFIHQS